MSEYEYEEYAYDNEDSENYYETETEPVQPKWQLLSPQSRLAPITSWFHWPRESSLVAKSSSYCIDTFKGDYIIEFLFGSEVPEIEFKTS